MRKLIKKFVALERKMAAERGPFTLFALFLREGAPGVWDFVLSAPWTDGDKLENYKYVDKHLRACLRPKDMMLLSRIVLIDEDNPGLEDVLWEGEVEHGLRELHHREFFGLPIKHAYIITSQKNPVVSTK
jgi:hypothetical protein